PARARRASGGASPRPRNRRRSRTMAGARSRRSRARSRRAPRSEDRSACRRRLLRLAVDLSLPPIEQALALGARAVLREVIADQLDLGELRSLRRQLGLPIRGNLELLGLGAELLRLRRERPVDELARPLQVARALDDAERADLVARAFARRLDLDGKAGDRLGHAVVHEADADRRLAARHRLDRADARARVLVDVAVELPQIAERVLLAEELHDRRDGRVGGPG